MEATKHRFATVYAVYAIATLFAAEVQETA